MKKSSDFLFLGGEVLKMDNLFIPPLQFLLNLLNFLLCIYTSNSQLQSGISTAQGPDDSENWWFDLSEWYLLLPDGYQPSMLCCLLEDSFLFILLLQLLQFCLPVFHLWHDHVLHSWYFLCYSEIGNIVGVQEQTSETLLYFEHRMRSLIIKDFLPGNHLIFFDVQTSWSQRIVLGMMWCTWFPVIS